MIKAFFKWFFILLLIILAAAYLTFKTYYHTQVLLNGSTIRIERDQYAIPTIHVSSMEQYFYAFGLVFAQDRLFQLSFRRYLAEGRLSQFLGEKTLQMDRFMREISLKHWSDQRAQRMLREDPKQYELFNYMAKGYNERVAKMPVLPLQFYLTGMKWQNFTVSHIICFSVFIEWSLSMNMIQQYTRSVLLANNTKEDVDWMFPNLRQNWAFKSIPIMTDDQIPERLRKQNVKEKIDKIKFNPLSVQRPIELEIVEFFKNFQASNSFAIHGNHTQSGLPILVNDPHLEPIVPGHQYQIRLNYTSNGRNYFSAAVAVAGNPSMFGKSLYLTQGVTICHGDNQDLFRQKIQGDKYFVDGKWRDLKIRNETILVKTSQGIRKDFYPVRSTHRGPIIHYIFHNLGSYNLQNDTISLSWTGYNTQWKKYSCFARNILIDNFDDALDYIQNCTSTYLNLNMMFTTADNHIISQQSGLHPIRRNPQSGYYLKDGTTTQHDWVGLVPSLDRMHIYDPPKGYVVHANNRVAQSDFYDGYFDYTAYTARADRIDELIRNQIASGRKINLEFARKVIYDTVDVYCRQIIPEITEVVQDSRQALSNFDCDFRSNSTEATQYEVFMYELYHLMKPVKLEKVGLIAFHYMQQGIFNYIHRGYNGDAKKQQIIKLAWKKAIQHIQTHFKTKDRSKWLWGQFHKDAGRHIPFRNNPILSPIYDLISPGFGNFHTPNVGKMQKLQFGNFQTTQRANLRTIYMFGQKDESQWSIDTGISENILSKHYSDQWKNFINNKMISIYGSKGQQADL